MELAAGAESRPPWALANYGAGGGGVTTPVGLLLACLTLFTCTLFGFGVLGGFGVFGGFGLLTCGALPLPPVTAAGALMASAAN